MFCTYDFSSIRPKGLEATGSEYCAPSHQLHSWAFNAELFYHHPCLQLLSANILPSRTWESASRAFLPLLRSSFYLTISPTEQMNVNSKGPGEQGSSILPHDPGSCITMEHQRRSPRGSTQQYLGREGSSQKWPGSQRRETPILEIVHKCGL